MGGLGSAFISYSFDIVLNMKTASFCNYTLSTEKRNHASDYPQDQCDLDNKSNNCGK